MALVKCKECGKEVSNKADKCPSCGAKMPKKTSPITWIALIAVLFVVYVTSTSPDKASPKTTASSTSSSTSPAKPAAPPAPKEPQWGSTTSSDEMSGERSAYAVSPTISTTRRMAFPYSDVKAWLGVGCDKSSEWAYIGFSGAPNLNNTELEDGYSVIKTRVKWGETLTKDTFTQKWGGKYLHFRNDSSAIQKIAGSNGMMLELDWHGQGAVHFDFPLKGSSKAIADIRASCKTF